LSGGDGNGRPGATPRVAVIIVAFNSGPDLQRALDGLEAQTYRDFEILLWDNASTDGAGERANLPHEPGSLPSRFIRSGENLGFAAANNRAAALADGELIALLNPDAVPEPAWLERLVAALDARADAVMAASLQLCAEDPDRLDGAGDVYHVSGVPYRGGFGAPMGAHIQTGEVFGPCGAAALYRRTAFEAAGGFDERYFCYVEDVDLAYRLRRAGGRCVFAHDAVVRHVGSASTGRRSEFSVYHGVRNRTWTLFKSTPAPLFPIIASAHILALALLIGVALVRRPQVLPATFRGLWAGVRGAGQFGADRRALAHSANGSVWKLVRAMTWSPLKLLRRGVDIRPYPPDAAP